MLPVFRTQLLDRRAKLELASVLGASPDISRLLDEVDAALARIDGGTFGACESCGEPIEADRLLADPLTRFCLDHLSPAEQRALQQDLELASRIQRELLPKRDARFDGWQVAYHYRPAGPVSGDYCDLIPGQSGQVYSSSGTSSARAWPPPC